MQEMMLSEVHVKCPVILVFPHGDGIQVDWLISGQVRQMIRPNYNILTNDDSTSIFSQLPLKAYRQKLEGSVSP